MAPAATLGGVDDGSSAVPFRTPAPRSRTLMLAAGCIAACACVIVLGLVQAPVSVALPMTPPQHVVPNGLVYERLDGSLRVLPRSSGAEGEHALWNVTRESAEAVPRVLVLTPMKDALGHIGRYFDNLAKLDYPREALSLGLMDGDSVDVPTHTHVLALRELVRTRVVDMEGLQQALDEYEGTGSTGKPANITLPAEPDAPPRLRGSAHAHTHTHAHKLKLTGTLVAMLLRVPELRASYRRITIFQHNFRFKLSAEARHQQVAQLRRRSVLARARNHALTHALRDEDFVLWIDSDLETYPADVLRALLASGKQLIVPNCVMTPGGRSYDLNSWRVRKASLGNNATVQQVLDYHDKELLNIADLEKLRTLKLEGYGDTGHVYLHHLRGDGDVVRLDAVGGAMLLVDAELHRHGLVFPPALYKNRIETEGLSMMALDMGVLSWGMPNVEIIHR